MINMPQNLSPVLTEVARNYRPAGARYLFHGRGHFFPGLEFFNLLQIGSVLLMQTYIPTEKEWVTALLARLQQDFPSFHVGVWKKQDQRGQEEIIFGERPRLVVAEEFGLRFQCDLWGKQNIGIFLDMALARQWVREQAAGKKVLNLFAYTCAFSVAAIAGGASKVVNLDLSKTALAIGRKNHQLNGHDVSGREVSFFAHDCLTSLNTHGKKEQFDLVIVDPPSFQAGSFNFRQDYPKILRKLNKLMPAGSFLLACLNYPGASRDNFQEMLLAHAPRLENLQEVAVASEMREMPGQGALKVLAGTFSGNHR